MQSSKLFFEERIIISGEDLDKLMDKYLSKELNPVLRIQEEINCNIVYLDCFFNSDKTVASIKKQVFNITLN